MPDPSKEQVDSTRKEETGVQKEVEEVSVPLKHSQGIDLYDLSIFEEERLGFVSISDKYRLSQHSDSLAIPNVEEKGIDKAEYFKLEGKYRDRFLSETKTAEADHVFVYDYTKDILVTIAVKNMNVVARLSPYVTPNEWPYSQNEYMIGYEIDSLSLKRLTRECFVYIGKENPFVQGQIKPMKWKQIAVKGFPSYTVTKEVAQLNEYAKGNVYKYETDSLLYFVQDFIENERLTPIARRLLVLDAKTKEIVLEDIYQDDEGTSLTPLNFVSEDDMTRQQWTGKLLRHKPPVVFGFQDHSFGCPYLSFLSLTEGYLVINCDNRH